MAICVALSNASYICVSYHGRLSLHLSCPDYINAEWLREDAENEITYDRTALPHCSYVDGHTLNIGSIASEIALHAMSYLDYPCKRDVS